MQDIIAIYRRLGKPEYFIIVIYNPYQLEILREYLPGTTTADRFDVTNRVFNLKLKAILDRLLNHHILGQVIGYTYIIEFQKRGLPHAHILLIIHPDDRIQTVADIDNIIRAEISNKDENPELYTLVLKYIIHNQCSGQPSDVYYNQKLKVYGKGYPKDEREYTEWNPSGNSPFYKRGHIESIRMENGQMVDNTWVVPYNLQLLKKYHYYINVEFCASMKCVQYLYIYIYKGPNKADISITKSMNRYYDNPTPNGRLRQPNEAVDEIKEYYEAR